MQSHGSFYEILLENKCPPPIMKLRILPITKFKMADICWILVGKMTLVQRQLATLCQRRQNDVGTTSVGNVVTTSVGDVGTT